MEKKKVGGTKAVADAAAMVALISAVFHGLAVAHFAMKGQQESLLTAGFMGIVCVADVVFAVTFTAMSRTTSGACEGEELLGSLRLFTLCEAIALVFQGSLAASWFTGDGEPDVTLIFALASAGAMLFALLLQRWNALK